MGSDSLKTRHLGLKSWHFPIKKQANYTETVQTLEKKQRQQVQIL
jgi:hypothetical protein